MWTMRLHFSSHRQFLSAAGNGNNTVSCARLYGKVGAGNNKI